MKKRTVGIAMLLGVASAMATTINFTVGEGYAADGALNAHPDWFADYNMYKVNGTVGEVSLSYTPGFKKAIYQPNLGTEDVYETGFAFSFDQTATNVLSDFEYIAATEFSDTSTGSGRIAMHLRRMKGNAENYTLVFFENSDGNTFLQGGGSSHTNLGFSATGVSSSDELWLGTKLIRGEDTTSWTVTGVLSNLTDGSELITMSVPAFAASSTYFNGNVYAVINSVDPGTESLTSNRVISVFSASAYGTMPPPDVVTFTEDQGYVPGTLSGQQSWVGHSEPGYAIDATTNFTTMPASASWKQAIYNVAIESNEVEEVGGVFRFQRLAEPPSSPKLLMAFDMKQGPNTGDKNMRVALKQLTNPTNNSYQLEFNRNTLGYTEFVAGMGITDEALGFGAGDDQSDDLAMSLKLYRGATSNDWAAVCVISNVTQGTHITALSEFDVVSSESYYLADLYGAINSVELESVSMVTNRQVDTFYIASSPGSITRYDAWALGWGLSGAEAATDANPDGDGLNNLFEYAVGGVPTDPQNTGWSASYAIVEDGGSDWFEFTHVQRNDPNCGVDYTVEATPRLVVSDWTNENVVVVSTNVLNSTFDTVTNRVPMVGIDAQFVRLRVEEK